MHTLAAAVQHYLHEILGIPPPLYRPWSDQDKLPYFLRDAFDFWKMDLPGRPVLLVMERGARQVTIGEIRTRLDKVQSLTDAPAVYVVNALASFERKRLIEQKVPFIVPGNQLYLPDLGIDLREYFRKHPNTAELSISPSAQALLITALLRPIWEVEWQPSEMIAWLGYTPMTRSRAVRELTAAGIVRTVKAGRTNILKLASTSKETWELAKPLLRSPVKRTVWAVPNGAMSNLPKRKAGMSALADYSMLTEPKWPVYAVSLPDWNSFWPRPEELPEPAPDAYEWQVWSYSPALLPHSDTVDLYSLILSLQDNADERVQIAVDELKGQLPW
jgi:hypothetical protein